MSSTTTQNTAMARITDAAQSMRAGASEVGSELRAASGSSSINILRVAGKELTGFFASPLGYIFIGAFLALNLFIFFWAEPFFARNIADVRPFFEWMPLLLVFLTSALTMRMWSEERRAGTLELLMTSPVKPLHLVLGKFLGCLALVAIALLLTIFIPLTVSALGDLDWGPVIGGYLAAICLSAAYISIGLFVSARTQSQIVALIVSVLICGAFYVIGSDQVAALFGNAGGELVRALGTGSRFDSITRGVIDLRDLYYYISIFGVFTIANLFALEQLRWSATGQRDRHYGWLTVAGLVVANLIAGNVWLAQLGSARADLTEGSVYSLSDTTDTYLGQLEEPLLIRGYFSAQTHPLLSPLVPRLQDLLREYEIAGDGRVRVELVDPAENPALEEEAGRRFGIQPVAFQTASRYQSSVTNSYFDIAVIYGDNYEVLTFRDLIEVNQAGGNDLEVELRNPEYDVTRAIKKVLADYRGGGSVFDGLAQPLRLRAYVSAADKLPAPLPELRTGLQEIIDGYEKDGGDKFAGEMTDPDAADAGVAAQLQRAGLQPLSAGIFNPVQFWFHIILDDGQRSQQITLPQDLTKDALQRVLDAELKRFTPGAVRTIAVHTPPQTPPNPQFGQQLPQGPSFRTLQQRLSQIANVEPAPLTDGTVPASADVLFVMDPRGLDEKQVFGVDQFLMRGGTVVVSTAAFRPDLSRELSVGPANSGLDDWLKGQGLELPNRMVLDPQNVPFPVPVTRNVNGFQIPDTQLVRYPPFIDVRGAGLAQENAPTQGLNQMTVPWAGPIVPAETLPEGVTLTRLVTTSVGSWTIAPSTLVPDFDRNASGFPPAEVAPDASAAERRLAGGPQLIGAMLEGTFTSAFKGKQSPLINPAPENAAQASDDELAGGEAEQPAQITSVLERSPESARLILLSSATMLSDDTLNLIATVDRARFIGPLTLAENIVDWSLEDRGLLALRAQQGQFARTLVPLSDGERALWEYINYGLAILGLLIVYLLFRRHRAGVRERAQRIMATA